MLVPAKGTYLELGVAPGYAGSKASLAVPVKVGLSASDYYEFGGEDEKFGYFSIAGIVTVPLGAHANIHGGAEFQAFGDSVKAYNKSDPDYRDDRHLLDRSRLRVLVAVERRCRR